MKMRIETYYLYQDRVYINQNSNQNIQYFGNGKLFYQKAY